MMPFVLKRPNGLVMRVAALVLGVAAGAIGSCSGFPETIDPALVFGPGDINELLDLHTDSHVDAGCSVEIIADNDRAFEAACELIRTAQDHINLETLYFGDDEGGDRDIAREFIALLAERVAAGVAVNVVVDAVAQGLFSKPELLDELEAAGVCLRRYAPPADKVLLDQVLYRTHKKILIADGRRALAGGRNMGFHYFGHGQWRDTSVLLTGPAVATLQREFARDWEALGGEVGDEARWFPVLAATGPVNLRLIDHRPAEDDFDLNTAVFLAVRSATARIDIATPNLNPPGWLADELAAAVGRGVRVGILTNSEANGESPSVWAAYAFWFKPLSEAGVGIHFWGRPGCKLHAKTLVVDDRLAIVGSHNFNCRSAAWDAENAVVFSDVAEVAEVAAMLESDFADPDVWEVDSAWLDAELAERGEFWEFAHQFGWLFKSAEEGP